MKERGRIQVREKVFNEVGSLHIGRENETRPPDWATSSRINEKWTSRLGTGVLILRMGG